MGVCTHQSLSPNPSPIGRAEPLIRQLKLSNHFSVSFRPSVPVRPILRTRSVRTATGDTRRLDQRRSGTRLVPTELFFRRSAGKRVRGWCAFRRRYSATDFDRPLMSPVLPRRRWSISRICDDDKPEQRSCKRLKPAAPATPAPQCSGSGRRCCLIRSRPGTLHTGRSPMQSTTRTTTIRPSPLRSNALSTGAFLATRSKT
jgi:hypothetical protein